MSRTNSISPVRVFVLVLVVVFAVEALIMSALAFVPAESRNDAWLGLLDSAALVAVLCPALWLLIVRPLQALLAERGAMLSRTLSVQEEERARLSRDLHDDLGQAQAAVLLGVRSVLNASTIEQAHERADGVHQMASAAIESTRRIARGLSPGVLHDFGIRKAVERVCEDLASASGIEIAADLPIDAVRLEPAIEIGVYRLVQEALTNAVKHSGATRVRVEIRLSNGQLSVSIADNGRGLPYSVDRTSAPGRGLGLTGMRERVSLLGGEMSISSAPSEGTTLRATIPTEPIFT